MSDVRNTSILFRVYSLLVISFFTIVFTVMIPLLNEKTAEKTPQETKAPGDIVAHIVWPNGDIDVDMWMTGPGEPVSVGYSNKGGLLWNLLRDDLGLKPDATPVNYEDAFTRGIVPGEYIINVQCYRCDKALFPMVVDAAVSIRNRDPDGVQGLDNFVVTKVIIKADGQEKTVVRFKVGEDLKVDMSSINNVYYKLRGNKPKEYAPLGGLPQYYIPQDNP